MKKFIVIILSMLILFWGFSSCNYEYSTVKNTTVPITNEIKTPQPTVSKATKKPEKEHKDIYYIGNKNTKKFHSPDCYTLPSEKNRVNFSSRSEAVNCGYSPCGNCCP